jgi:hypothetical protein
MIDNVRTKNIPLYFYTMAVEKSQSSVPYDAQTTLNDLCEVLDWLKQKGEESLINIKHEMVDKKKVMWLHEQTCIKASNDTRIAIVFKSAKYDQVRDVIDTEKMQPKGRVKQERDGDEEKSHILLRLGKTQSIYTAVFESNHYGITISDVERYFNDNIERYFIEKNIERVLKVKFTPYFSKDFLEELKKMEKRNILSIIVDKEMLTNSGSEWMDIAGRNDIRQTVTLVICKEKRGTSVPDDLIKSFYSSMSWNSKIRRIRVEGSTSAGQLKIDTESMQLRHSLQVELTPDTHEVYTHDCFIKIQNYLESMDGV